LYDVLLLVGVILYTIFFASLGALLHPMDDYGWFVSGITGTIVEFIGGGVLLVSKHLAWISLFSFLLLLASLIVDALFLTAWLAGIRQRKAEG
jgi:hypothetical protein